MKDIKAITDYARIRGLVDVRIVRQKYRESCSATATNGFVLNGVPPESVSFETDGIPLLWRVADELGVATGPAAEGWVAIDVSKNLSDCVPAAFHGDLSLGGLHPAEKENLLGLILLHPLSNHQWLLFDVTSSFEGEYQVRRYHFQNLTVPEVRTIKAYGKEPLEPVFKDYFKTANFPPLVVRNADGSPLRLHVTQL